MKESAEVLVLGGGLTGLCAARRLKDRGVSGVCVLEREDRPGGLLKTHRDVSVEIDHLPHVFFTQDQTAAAFFHAIVGEVRRYRHRLGVLWHGGYVDYPFQNHVHQLSLEDRRRVLVGLLQSRAAGARPPSNLDEYAESVLGQGIHDLFFRPYNQKLWQTPLQEMGWQWLESKIRLPDHLELADSILGTRTSEAGDLAPHAEFCYPARGGIETLVDGLLASLGGRDTVRCASMVRAIDTKRRLVQTDRGSVSYQQLLSTLPIDQTARLARLRVGRGASARLRATKVVCAQFVLHDIRLPDYHWIYVPDPDLSFYRMTRVELFSPDAAPGRRVLLVERAEPSDSRADPQQSAARMQEELERLGILPAGSVAERRVFAYSPAGVVPHRTHQQDVAVLREGLRRVGIACAGRFGEWALYNMDHSILAGFRAADAVVGQ